MVYTDETRQKVEPVTEELKIRRERELREYYDEKLGDHVKVGFRLCEGRAAVELSRCLYRGEFHLLVLGYEGVGALYGDMPVEDFARDFRAPVVLVGPEAADRFHLNGLAELRLGELDIPGDRWSRLPPQPTADASL